MRLFVVLQRKVTKSTIISNRTTRQLHMTGCWKLLHSIYYNECNGCVVSRVVSSFLIVSIILYLLIKIQKATFEMSISEKPLKEKWISNGTLFSQGIILITKH